jgi:hypothetical protein
MNTETSEPLVINSTGALPEFTVYVVTR